MNSPAAGKHLLKWAPAKPGDVWMVQWQGIPHSFKGETEQEAIAAAMEWWDETKGTE